MTPPEAALAGRTWQALWARVLADQGRPIALVPSQQAGVLNQKDRVDFCMIFAVRT